ncbi:MAG: hypothetical protein QXM23_04575 [Archaeoglobaceae archaeon]|uniref:Uncharacterized protein n=1 Tax=Archaeoglobus fulgidus TaxID=2234 RepID=A0A7J3M1X8_ARCFL
MKDLAKTIVPIALGVIAGVVSMLITQGIRERDPFGIIVLVMFIYIQKFLFPKLGIKLEPKDWLSISFLSLASWYVCWTLILNV